MNTKELINRYSELMENDYNNFSELALLRLLKANSRHIEGLIEEDSSGGWFHKSFRQVDVTECGNTDMAIWYLLQTSSVFWTMVNEENK
tara:strand:+ start:123 stop:389 length:267 start_codon:yes stop_codon:yes gene_type:complete